ncbi:hypothetical protein [Kitasatospora cheerisanensis]|uniref:Uncharacterized protein n=1 Tax=Kitasatospora cheerisanensis KCTC 2395 TaxID=1348663 RepID=A0A066YSF4_9ACTN|nr:hypothetical protein [Kitasatospora cheerisanensis]KDN82914.1 hypothetical protein KCH_52740 [Kitasatospora cheerisanensis KCTC 2395]
MPTDHAQPPYRLTAATPRPHHDTTALVDHLLAAWLKAEGHDEPPPRDHGARRSDYGSATGYCWTATADRCPAEAPMPATAAADSARPLRTAPTN